MIFGYCKYVREAAPYLASYLQPSNGPRTGNAWLFDPPCSLFDVNVHQVNNNSLKPASVILELGSGNGYLGINHLAPVLVPNTTLILTDLNHVIPLLSSNVSRSSASLLQDRDKERKPVHIQVQALEWGDNTHLEQLQGQLRKDKKQLSHILCSDLVYFPNLFEPLLKTLLWLTDHPEDGPKIEIIMGCKFKPSDALSRLISGDTEKAISADKIRSLTKETPFWESFGVYFDLWPVIRRRSECAHNASEAHALYDDDYLAISEDSQEAENENGTNEDTIFIFLAHRKSGTGTDMALAGRLSTVAGLLDGKDGQFEELLMLRSMALDEQ